MKALTPRTLQVKNTKTTDDEQEEPHDSTNWSSNNDEYLNSLTTERAQLAANMGVMASKASDLNDEIASLLSSSQPSSPVRNDVDKEEDEDGFTFSKKEPTENAQDAISPLVNGRPTQLQQI